MKKIKKSAENFYTVFKRVKKKINFVIVFLSVARPHVGKP
jgi:hypothetical protein